MKRAEFDTIGPDAIRMLHTVAAENALQLPGPAAHLLHHAKRLAEGLA